MVASINSQPAAVCQVQMPAKLLVAILTAGSFQRHAFNLLLAREIKVRWYRAYTRRYWSFHGFQLLCFSVHAAAHGAMAHHNYFPHWI